MKLEEGGLIKLLTIISKAGIKAFDNQEECFSVLEAIERLSELPEDEARTIIEKAFSEIHNGREIPDEQTKEIIRQLNFRQPESLLVPLTKVGNKMYDGKTDFTGGKLVNTGTKKKEALVKVETFVSTITEDGLTLSKPLTRYDKQVQNGVFSLIESGQTVFSSKQVYEAFAGKSSTSAQAIGKVTQSLNKMRTTLISIDWTEHARLNGLPFDSNRGDFMVSETYLLPLDRIRMNSYGQEIDAFQVIAMPVLYRYAKAVGQVCTIERSLFSVPVSNTDSSVVIRNELLQRIEQIKNPRNKIGNTIRFSWIYDLVGVTDKTIKDRRRKDVIKMLDEWVGKKHFHSYTIEKSKKEFHSIVIFATEGERISYMKEKEKKKDSSKMYT